jgi:hypothetical protein
MRKPVILTREQENLLYTGVVNTKADDSATFQLPYTYFRDAAGNYHEDTDANLLSDGYHTFGELYDHRITLFIALLRCKAMQMDSMNCELEHKGQIWRAQADSSGAMSEEWFMLGIFKEFGKQITYHLPMSRWDECDFAEELERAPEWDQHTSKDVLERLARL